MSEKKTNIFAEQLKLQLEKKYHLNVIKEISVTDSFLTLDKDIRGCQVESFDDCTTEKYIDTLRNKCQCWPFQLGLDKKVY